jgi:hypothetical protein
VAERLKFKSNSLVELSIMAVFSTILLEVADIALGVGTEEIEYIPAYIFDDVSNCKED